ncbi:type I-E CRISPR-associated protein Cas7/Cse4/CasC [Candidatus Accumulibacter sp. ACC003]|uniref:type I-E CRISPR-associated protein Cas7/Cse4/CasC n=1 Tax=Candidatus Accumulibacter sp. ACC003 TaxID=2823334 RepID=UPI0025C0AFD6|nr:type I-E CRISPR-associated protein Cas7/Cse4/CasC [Candidatus Accumulibacter sp. ACC003]
MSIPRFIQIHTLHTYPAALLNRDDAGLAKRLPLGNAVRTRISSQCLKRHWRVTEDQFSLKHLGVPMAARSRIFVDKIQEMLVASGIALPVAEMLSSSLKNAFSKGVDKLIKEAKKKQTTRKSKKAGSDDEQDEISDEADGTGENGKGQAILLGLSEYEYLKSLCLDVGSSATDATTAKLLLLERLKSERSNIENIPLGCGLEAALFGRMVTSDLLASRDAAVYVAHAFTVHQAQVESDYFTVVDDLLQMGSAGIFDTELASGLYYGYVVVDVPQLVQNLEGEDFKDCFASGTPAERRVLAGRVVQHLLHLIATVSPGAKRGSTAPFDWAKFMLIEAGDWQPRSLAGAFHDALPLDGKEGTIRQRTVNRLTREIAAMDDAYGAPLSRRFLAVDPEVEVPGAERLNLGRLADWAKEIIEKGAC